MGPILVLLIILFKMKKLQILLNPVEKETQSVIKELFRHVNLLKIGIVLFSLQLVIQITKAVIYGI